MTKEWMIEELKDWYDVEEMHLSDNVFLIIKEEIEKNTKKDISIKTTAQNVFENMVRLCDSCFNVMIEGFCIYGGDYYYCSEECLKKENTEEEIKEMNIGSDSESYYTEWLTGKVEERYIVMYVTIDDYCLSGLVNKTQQTFEECVKSIENFTKSEFEEMVKVFGEEVKETYNDFLENISKKLEGEFGNKHYKIISLED